MQKSILAVKFLAILCVSSAQAADAGGGWSLSGLLGYLFSDETLVINGDGSCEVTYTGNKRKAIVIPDGCRKLNVRNRGSGDLTISCKTVVAEATVKNAGSNDLKMTGLNVTKMTLHDRGSGSVYVSVSGVLTGNEVGNGSLTVYGNPNRDSFLVQSYAIVNFVDEDIKGANL